MYTFLVRLYHEPDSVIREVEEELWQSNVTLQDLHDKFMDWFSRGFCHKAKDEVTINVHTFYHMEKVRKEGGLLHGFSAEPFESLYAVMRRCYTSGTPNTPKQIMENSYIRNRYKQYPHGICLISFI